MLKWIKSLFKSNKLGKRPIRLTFQIPLMYDRYLYIDKLTTDTYLEIVLDENDNLKSGKLIFIDKSPPKIIRGINLKPKRIDNMRI